MKKRLTAILLVACMVITWLPGYASADDTAISVAPTAEAANSPEENIVIEGETTPASTLLSDSGNNGIPVIEADTETLAEITAGGEYAYFQYTPEYTESYTFTSLADGGTYGYLYDSDMNELASNDDSENRNFSITYTLEAGNTYVLAARYYSSSNTGSFNVILKTNHSGEGTVIIAKTCTEDGLAEYTCSVCGLKYTEVIPAGHSYDEAKVCVVCGEEWHVEGTCGENITWYLDKTGTLTISGEGAMYNYDWNTMPWYEYQSEIFTVIIEDGVTSIGNYAFYYYSSLTSIDIPDGVTSIGDHAFAGCSSLTSIVIPESVTSIGLLWVAGCSSLTSLIVDGNNAAYSSDDSSVLFDKEKRTLLCAPGAMSGAYSIPDGVTSIGDYAFIYCSSLTSIDIPNSVTSIGGGAFEGCGSLTSIDIPDGVTSIGSYVFTNCSSLTSIDIPDGVTSIGSYAFYSCSNLTSIDIPDSVVSLGSAAFSGCSSLTSIDIPDGVTSIGYSAFYDCSSLTSIDIPDGVTSIGDNAFAGCGSLTSIDIPDEVTSICNDAFSNCDSLTSILFNGDAPTLYWNIFSGVTASSYYPMGNATWTKEVMLNYGGNITWIGVGDLIGLEIASIPIGGIVGEDPDWHGLRVERVYSNGVRIPIAISELTIGEIDTSTAGKKTVTVSYGELTAEFVYGVHEGEPAVVLDPSTYPESSHSYENSMDETQTLTYPGATGLVLVFSQETYTESGYDYIYVYDGSDNLIAKYSGSEASGLTVEVPGDTVKIRLTSDGSNTGYGYSFASISTADSIVHTGNAGTAVDPTCTTDGSTAGIICDICGNHVNYETIPALGHSYNDEGVCDRCGYKWFVEGACGENVTWYLDKTGTLTISGEGAIFNYDWNTMPWYDYNSSILKVVIEEGVTTIGENAFYSCASLSSVEIGDSMTSIGKNAFNKCHSLASIEIPDGVTTIGNGAFYYCDSLTGVLIPGSVTTIGESAFQYCESLTNVDLPDSVTSIGDSAFFGCSSLTGVDLPDGVTSVGESMFSQCSSLIGIGIPDSVISIGSYAFSGCSSLTSIDIPGGVTTIAYNAFENCDSLTSVVIPNSVVTIGAQAFTSCSSLTSVEIGDSVTTIGNGAFEYCRSLTNVEIGDSVTTIGSYAFNECDSLISVAIPDSVTAIYGSAFRNCDSLTSMVIPDSVTSISSYTFGNCPSLISVEIPDSVTTIGESAFYYCTSLTGVTIPDSVTSIGEWAFGYCRSMSSVVIPNSVTTIGEKAFLGCSSLTAIQVDESNPSYSSDSQGILYDKEKTTLIQAPGAISALREIPDSVTTIGNGAFYYCDSLTGVLIPGSVTTIGESAFQYCESLTNVEIGDSVTTIGSGAFASCTSLTSIVIGDSVTTIGSDAFQNCDSLISVAIPDSVTTIYGSAFWYCDNLTKIRFLGDAPAIAANSFSGVTATAYYPVDNATWTEEVMQNYGGTITWAPCYVVLEDGTSTEVAPGEEAVIHIDADHTTLVAVYMDDELVDPSNYTVTEGSTIIKFTAEFMATLSEGNHEVFVEFQNGVANATITVVVPAYIPGDINGDGNVNARDVTKLLQYLAEWDVEVVEAALDINGDGNVNVRDVTTLKQYIAGWDVVIN